MPFWFDQDWSEHFDVKIQAEKEGNDRCDVLVSPVAWTSMEQVVSLRKAASAAEVIEGLDESGRRFRAEIEHLASNWDSLTAGEMSCVKYDNGSAKASCLSFDGKSAINDIYRLIQPVFRVAEGATDVVERFSGAWGAALDDLAKAIEGQEYEYISPQSKIVTYRLSVSVHSSTEISARLNIWTW